MFSEGVSGWSVRISGGAAASPGWPDSCTMGHALELSPPSALLPVPPHRVAADTVNAGEQFGPPRARQSYDAIVTIRFKNHVVAARSLHVRDVDNRARVRITADSLPHRSCAVRTRCASLHRGSCRPSAQLDPGIFQFAPQRRIVEAKLAVFIL